MDALTKALKKKTATALSAPSRAYHGVRGRKYDSARTVLKAVHGMKGAPDFDENGVTDYFKTRAVAKGIRHKYTNEN